jgi:hypothetical protein
MTAKLGLNRGAWRVGARANSNATVTPEDRDDRERPPHPALQTPHKYGRMRSGGV